MPIQNKHIIKDMTAIRKALGASNSMPDAFLGRKILENGLAPKGFATYVEVDVTNPEYSGNFNDDETYPIYDHEGEFVIGADGVGYIMVPVAWKNIKWLD